MRNVSLRVISYHPREWTSGYEKVKANQRLRADRKSTSEQGNQNLLRPKTVSVYRQELAFRPLRSGTARSFGEDGKLDAGLQPALQLTCRGIVSAQ
jgi:hypothetical protein